MRYIGNKTKLLGFIEKKLATRGLLRPGLSAVDPFSGTASVGHHLKRLGYRVVASDIMTYGYVFARAYVEVPALPVVGNLAGGMGQGARQPRPLPDSQFVRRPPLEVPQLAQHRVHLELSPDQQDGRYDRPPVQETAETIGQALHHGMVSMPN